MMRIFGCCDSYLANSLDIIFSIIFTTLKGFEMFDNTLPSNFSLLFLCGALLRSRVVYLNVGVIL